MTANMNSVRLQILEAIVNSFAAMTADQPTDDPYGVTFSTVALGPLADWDQRKRYSLGVVAGPERETYQYPFVMSWITVNLEFRVTVNRDDDSPGKMIEELLTVVKRRAVQDRQWGGLAIDTKITGSEIDLLTYADRSAVGVCMVEVQFRYGFNDPRTQNPSF
jgi:hypothetical protein